MAGPVLDGGEACEITNYRGPDRRFTLSSFPESLIPSGRLVLLNDLEATCRGIIALEHPSSPHKLGEFFSSAWPSSSSSSIPSLRAPGKYCVLAAGTGLGTAAVVWLSSTSSWTVLGCEGGHATIYPLGSGQVGPRRKEQRMLNFAEKCFNRGREHGAEYETIVSGEGLRRMYQWAQRERQRPMRDDESLDVVIEEDNVWMSHLDHQHHEHDDEGKKKQQVFVPSAQQVAQWGVSGEDEDASSALMWHYRYLARCTQMLCVTMMLKDGVFWAGDNGVSNKEWIQNNAHLLREEFANHAKKDWIRDTPLFIQTKSLNFNLQGAIFQAELLFH